MPYPTTAARFTTGRQGPLLPSAVACALRIWAGESLCSGGTFDRACFLHFRDQTFGVVGVDDVQGHARVPADEERIQLRCASMRDEIAVARRDFSLRVNPSSFLRSPAAIRSSRNESDFCSGKMYASRSGFALAGDS